MKLKLNIILSGLFMILDSGYLQDFVMKISQSRKAKSVVKNKPLNCGFIFPAEEPETESFERQTVD